MIIGEYFSKVANKESRSVLLRMQMTVWREDEENQSRRGTPSPGNMENPTVISLHLRRQTWTLKQSTSIPQANKDKDQTHVKPSHPWSPGDVSFPGQQQCPQTISTEEPRLLDDSHVGKANCVPQCWYSDFFFWVRVCWFLQRTRTLHFG